MPSLQPVNLKSHLSKTLCARPSYPCLFLSNYRAALAQRAFQDVPRSLRRRSASHNVKRVPGPLREKAKREMIADGTKPPAKIRGRRRLRMEKRRLSGKSLAADQSAEMDIDQEEPGNIPKLKPRKVVKGKFAHRQGLGCGVVVTNGRG
jgi:hypothetical protein